MFRFEKDFPEEIRAPITAILEAHQQIIPSWCEHVTVFYSLGGNNGDLNVATHVDYPYRFAQVYVYAGWLNSKDREKDLIHELFHIVTGPCADTAEQIITTLTQDLPAKACEVIKQQLRDGVEMMTQDLTIQYFSGRLSFPKK